MILRAFESFSQYAVTVAGSLSREDRYGSRLCKNADVCGWAGKAGWPAQPVSCSDRFHQPANTQNAHHPFHVVGQNV